MSRRYEWGYGPANGPDMWPDYFPFSKGECQSPIELHTRYIKHDGSLRPWNHTYHPSSSLTIVNDGTTVKVVFDDSSDKSVLKDGPLRGTYRLRQLQFHWGSSDDQGSEHVIDGLRYAGEIGKAKPHLKLILEALDCIMTKGKKAHFTDFDPSILFPTSHDYWTYQGSFTTPPCEECVTWLLLREPITISPEQMEKFRNIFLSMACEVPLKLVNNYRPTQPLNGREVRASFD
ncbi:carbonic anhydrase 3-like isoform X2 [Lithobates pipiens]